MSSDGKPLNTRDVFLRELEAEGVDIERLVEHSMPRGSIEQPQPLAPSKKQVLARMELKGRFYRFAAEIAAMLELPIERVKALLDRIPDESAWSSDIPVGQAFWLPGGVGVADCVRGFVRIAAGGVFPEHEHLGEERKLVLQGAFVDGATGLCYRAGDVQVGPAGSCHGIAVPADGVDLLALVVTRVGYRIGSSELRPRAVE